MERKARGNECTSHNADGVHTLNSRWINNASTDTYIKQAAIALPVAAAPNCILKQNDNIIFWLDWHGLH